IYTMIPHPPPRPPLFPYTTLFRSLFGAAYAPVEAAHPDAREKLKFNEALKHVLDSLATDLIESTQKRVLAYRVSSTEDVRRAPRSEEHTSELQSRFDLVCRLLLEK